MRARPRCEPVALTLPCVPPNRPFPFACRSVIEKIRAENAILKGELGLDNRQSRMLDSEGSVQLIQSVEKEAAALARRIDELGERAQVCFAFVEWDWAFASPDGMFRATM